MLFSSVLFAVALAHSRFIVKLKAHEGLVKRDSEELDLGWVKEIITKHDGNSFAESEPSAITYEYNFNNFMGFAVQTSDEAIAEIEANPNVEYWTHDNPITLFAPTPQDQQVSAVKSWGLDRIDQRALPLNSEFKSMPFKGEGVTVFVIDTGIDSRHPDFEGRARVGPSFVHGVYTELKTDNSDTNGHGTHCSGTIASKSFGVAPKATIIGLKIFDNTGGGDAGVIAAVQYAVKNAVPGKTVISMSIGTDLQNCVPNPKPNQEGCNNQAMKDAVKAAVAANIPVAAAAGNDNTDACRY
jgi:serine protease